MIKTLIWNIRSVKTQQGSINMQREHGFFIVALMEPFQKTIYIHRCRRRLGIEADIGKHIMLTFVYAKCSSLESPFTWWNGRPNEECIFKRLNRILVNLPFQNLFPDIEVEHLIRTGLDHAPLLMNYGEEAMKFVKPFMFLNFWTKHETFMEVVRQNWMADFIKNLLLMFKQKLKRVKIAISKWSKLTYGDIFKQFAIREDVVRIKEMLFEEEPIVENTIVLQQAQAELKKYLSIEEKYWKQKNLELCKFPAIDEVKSAVFALSGDSASGPGGFTGLFYQHCWDIVGEDIFRLPIELYGGAFLPKPVTHTNLVLLPKKPKVQTFSDLRPISLSNFINKVISSVLHDRLEKILPSLISANQPGFVKGRNIIENILLA
ncbi:uncharacterized protein [Nicotiana tomentosiformis]|uniref:uncharacterized protein n=1 Tax=Nicotiana tomentosiformis TaxID=4098 RepID=UPI00388CE30F